MSVFNTLLDDAIIGMSSDFQKFENRKPKIGATEAFRKYTDMVVPSSEIQSLKVSKRRPVKIAVAYNDAVTVNTVRAINPTPNELTTNLVPISWSTKAFSISIEPSVMADNYITQVEGFRQLMFNSMKSVVFSDANSIENQCVAYLSANKWATPPASGVPGVSVSSGAYVTDSKDYILKAPVIMSELDMTGRLQDIGNVASLARRRDIATYGSNNSRNIDQFQEDLEYFVSSKVAVTSGMEETHYVVPMGSLALLNIVEWDARNRTEHNTGEYQVIQDPFYGFEWGVRIVKEPANISGTYGSGYERAVRYRYDFAADFGLIHTFSSAAGQSPIVKIDTTTI